MLLLLLSSTTTSFVARLLLLMLCSTTNKWEVVVALGRCLLAAWLAFCGIGKKASVSDSVLGVVSRSGENAFAPGQNWFRFAKTFPTLQRVE